MKHAMYSPSAMARNLKCPASPRRIQAGYFPDRPNHATARGSVVHVLAERTLRDSRYDLSTAEGKTWAHYCPDLSDDLGANIVDSEMVHWATQYVACVLDMVRPGDQMWIESKLTYSDALFGTADLELYDGARVLIGDLKTGRVPVPAYDNKQLLTYAAMALDSGAGLNCEEIHLVIFQPSISDSPDVWVTDTGTVYSHLVDVEAMMLSDAAAVGEHCRYCPVKPSCPDIKAIASKAGGSLDGLTPDEWADTLAMVAVLAPWCKAVTERAEQLALTDGLRVPGYKLVTRTGRKTWASPESAAADLLDAGADEAAIYNRTLRTPTQLKKELKQSIDPDFIESLSEIPSRGFALVPESDKRPGVDAGLELLTAADKLPLFS